MEPPQSSWPGGNWQWSGEGVCWLWFFLAASYCCCRQPSRVKYGGCSAWQLSGKKWTHVSSGPVLSISVTVVHTQ